MAANVNSYTNILKDRKILYVPSCLVVEMMTKLYNQVSMINLSDKLHYVVPDLLILLRRMSLNLRATAEAYRQERIRFFIGDWKDDKQRARKLFYNLMSRLGYMSELLGAVEKGLLYKAIEEMTEEWTALDQIMESRCNEGYRGDKCAVQERYFRSDSPNNWQQLMAKTVLSLSEDDSLDDPDTYLILLCYNRIRLSLLRVIDELQRKIGGSKRISPEKILCVSREDVCMSCPKCTFMTDCVGKGAGGATEVIRKGYTPSQNRRISLRKVSENTRAAQQQYRRHIMPPSLVGISGGKR